MVGIIFIIGLVVVSGFVAYVGDNVGRKVGRAKMRLFGLRPKYTSIIVAIFTGMVITAITITVLAVSSEPVRAMLFKFKELRQDLALAQSDLEESEYRLNAISQQLDNSQTQLNEVNTELDEAKSVISSQDVDIILKQQMLDEIELEYDSLVAVRQDLDDQVSTLNESLSVARSEADDLNARLSETNRQINLRTREVADLESQRDDISAQLDDLVVQTDQLKEDITTLEALKEAEVAKVTHVREFGVDVFKGQILQEFKVSTSLNDSEIIRKIIGAKLIWDTEDPENKHGNPMAEPTIEQYTDVIDDINRYKNSFGDETAVIRIIASEYVFGEGVVPVTLKVERYLLIYEEGEVIARKLIDKDDNYDSIRISLYEMLQVVEQEALEKGMIFEGIEEAVWVESTEIVDCAKKGLYYANDYYINLVAKRDIYNTEYLVLAPYVPENDNMKFVIEEIEPDTEWSAPP